MIGDYNVRIGYESDIISTIDEDIVKKRLCVDNVVVFHIFVVNYNMGYVVSHICDTWIPYFLLMMKFCSNIYLNYNIYLAQTYDEYVHIQTHIYIYVCV